MGSTEFLLTMTRRIRNEMRYSDSFGRSFKIPQTTMYRLIPILNPLPLPINLMQITNHWDPYTNRLQQTLPAIYRRQIQKLKQTKQRQLQWIPKPGTKAIR